MQRQNNPNCVGGGISAEILDPSAGGNFTFTASSGPMRYGGLTNSTVLNLPNLSYSIQLSAQNTARIIEKGYLREDVPFTDGDVFEIAVQNGVVTYLRNASVVFTSPTPAQTPLHAEALLLSLTSRLDSPFITFNQVSAAAPALSGLSAVWANTGEDKITQDELRATKNPHAVTNSAWDGKTIQLFGAQNEMLGFNIILEAANQTANNVSVDFVSLVGPAGATISSPPPDPSKIYDWTERNIELFFIRYLQIKGLSYFGYQSGMEGFDERIVPQRFERPWTGNGVATGSWTDRPDHDKFYPDIAIPSELCTTFSVAEGYNQSIWADIYVPKGTPPGTYMGTVSITENSSVTWQIPVQLVVHAFALPDQPTAKTMVYYSTVNLADRFTGTKWAQPGSPEGAVVMQVQDRLFQMAHRHKISMIGDSEADASGIDAPSAHWQSSLQGSLFTADAGYNGPGAGVGSDVYSVGTYAVWRNSWMSGSESAVSESDVWTHSDNWESWFQANAPATERFLYVCDECIGNNGTPGPAQVNTWAGWVKSNPSIGNSLHTMATISFDTAAPLEPNVDFPTNTAIGRTSVYDAAVSTIMLRPGSQINEYNPYRPYAGSFTIEDDGVSLRELAWAQYKKDIHRLYYWESTYWKDNQVSGAENDLFHDAETFGVKPAPQDVNNGAFGYGATNGEGVLFYPGTDMVFPNDSYNVQGVFASLRLKHWRRGIQDVDYLALAAAKNPAAVQAIVQQMVPQALWDLGDLGGWIISPIPWSNNPDTWENARAQLAAIIDNQPLLTGASRAPQSPATHTIRGRVYGVLIDVARAVKYVSHQFLRLIGIKKA